MKKWLVVFVLFIVLIIGCSYVLIPDRIKISKFVAVTANLQGAFRVLEDKNNWGKWWPVSNPDKSSKKGALSYGSYHFQINQILHNAVEINLSANNKNINSILQVFSYGVDSISLNWSTELITGSNPLRKIQQYVAAKKLGIYFEEILDALKKYLNIIKNIYGIEIKKEKIQYQLLISTKKSFSFYPTTPEVYSMIDKLRKHLRKYGEKTDGLPLLNIQGSDSTNYIAQVALPVTRKIPEENSISVKWIMKDGNILTGEVMGDYKTVDSSMIRFEQYIYDYQRTIIAMPFQLLITDRSKEPDSTKWITRLYYPVI